MSKHTPGPWQISRQGSSGDPRRVITGKHGAMVAEIPPEGDATNRTHWAKDDAALIAAAPDLLAALRRLALWVERDTDNDAYIEMSESGATDPENYPTSRAFELELVREARAAISKAEAA
jgi:hypothetical protein